MSIKKTLTNSKGMTLVEILATLVITAIVIIIVLGVIVNAQKAQLQQSKVNEQVVKTTQNFKQLNADIRRSDEVLCTNTTGDSFSTHYSDTGITVLYEYDSSQKILYKDTEPFINELSTFSLGCTTVDAKTYVDSVEVHVDNDTKMSSKIIVRSGNR